MGWGGEGLGGVGRGRVGWVSRYGRGGFCLDTLAVLVNHMDSNCAHQCSYLPTFSFTVNVILYYSTAMWH